MKALGWIIAGSAVLTSACGGREAETAEVSGQEENVLAAPPGEFGTVEGSYDVAGEGGATNLLKEETAAGEGLATGKVEKPANDR